MPGTPTTKYAIPTLDGNTDLARSIDDVVNSSLSAIDSKMVGYSEGAGLGPRPTSTPGSPGVAGRRYRDTTSGAQYIDTGTSWVEIGETWRTVAEATSRYTDASLTEQLLVQAGLLATSGAVPYGIFAFNPADYLLEGRTLKARIVGAWARNTISPGNTFNVGIKTISSSAGGSGTHTLSAAAGANVGNSAALTASAAASGTAVSTEFDAPAAGLYAFRATWPGAITGAGSVGVLNARLQIRNV